MAVKRNGESTMTVTECVRRHRLWTVFLLLAAGVVTSTTTYAITESARAREETSQVAEELHVHMAAQAEHEKHTDATLGRIETILKDVQDSITN